MNLGISINSSPYLSLIHLNKITFQFQKKCPTRITFTIKPFSQLKLVQVLQGKVLDVIVDLRKESKTFGKHEKIYLNSNDRKILWIPEGCAHGFYHLKITVYFLINVIKIIIKNQKLQLERP